MLRTTGMLVLALGLSACSGLSPTQPGDPPPTPTSTVNYTAIGASDAIGYGSSAACLPFTDCPNGKGYVQVIARRLQTDGRIVKLQNLGLPGGVLGRDLQTLGNQLDLGILTNFIDNQVPFVASDSTVVTVFAGGNDVNTVARALKSGLGGSDPGGYLRTMRQGFARDLKALVSGIRGRAPATRIVALNLPNMAALPYSSGLPLAEKRVMQDIAVGFSAEINALTADGALVVDIMCDASFYQPGVYSSDGFHPNDAGYARMADVAYPAVLNGQASLPRSSCSQMSVY